MNEKPKPCPFCGEPPAVLPVDPKTEGNAWGAVACQNSKCPCQPPPNVRDGEAVSDERGPDEYKRVAVRRWNAAIQANVKHTDEG